jgi:hypothetical protein
MMLSDEEYREWLQALAQKHLRIAEPYRTDGPPQSSSAELINDIERVSSIARFAGVVKDRSENQSLVKALANELYNAKVDSIAQRLDAAGVLAALDELPEVTFGELRRSVIPDEDIHLLRRAGVDDPEAEIRIIIEHARFHLGFRSTRLPESAHSASEIAHSAQVELNMAAKDLEAARSFEPKKKRKIFNGIGKILGGAVAGAGNLLIATGTIVAPNPATAAMAIASGAVAVTSIFTGIGDLRGE